MEQNNDPAPSEAPVPETPPAPAQPIDAPKSDDIVLSDSKPTKSNKALIWCLSIMAIIGIVATAVFAYLYFTTPTTPVNTPGIDNQTSTTEPDTTEETEITDAYILRDLDEKISILNDMADKNKLFIVNPYLYGRVNTLYTEGTLSEIAKLTHVVNSIQPDYVLNYDEKKSIVDEQGLDYDEVTEGVKADTVEAKYLDVFGEKVDKSILNNQSNYCPIVHYNTKYNFYYLENRCGGTGPYIGYFYKNKYAIEGNHAFVYVSVGTFNREDHKFYCDYMNHITFETNPPAICGESDDAYALNIDESNYQDFAQYRFVFNKADNGTYYFSKVEKL